MFRSLACCAFVLIALFFAGTGMAGAHAALMSTDPQAGAEVAHGPAVIRLHFGEAVETSLGSIRILDDAGTDHASSKPFHPGGDPAWVAVQAGALPRGHYVVAWNVISSDSHAVNGAFAFGVGVPAGDVAMVQHADVATGTLFAVMRFFSLSALLIGAGLAFALTIVVRPIGNIRTTMIEFAAWIVVAFFACADVVAHAVVDGGTLGAVLSTQFGLLRALLLCAAILAVIAVSVPRRRTGLLGVAAAVAIISESLSGHGATGLAPAVGIAADIAHLIAAAAWIGALIATLIVSDVVDARRTSLVATASIVLLVASSVIQTVRNVDSIAALVNTTYGLLICAKIALLVIALAFAAVSRRRVEGGARALARSVRAELLVLTVVVAVTGVLVDGRPPRSAVAAAATASVNAQFTVRDLHVAVDAEPVAADRWRIHVMTDRAGSMTDADAVEASLREGTRHVGPLAVSLRHDAVGSYTGDVALPFAGRWTVTVSVRSGDFDEGQTFVNLAP